MFAGARKDGGRVSEGAGPAYLALEPPPTEVACVLGERRNRASGCPWADEESGRTGGTLLPTSARLPPVPRPIELLKVTNCFHY